MTANNKSVKRYSEIHLQTLPLSPGRVASMHRAAEKGSSRQPVYKISNNHSFDSG
jgi:hypothetical protein